MPSGAHRRNSSHGTREDGPGSREKEKGLRSGPEEHLRKQWAEETPAQRSKGDAGEEEGQGKEAR